MRSSRAAAALIGRMTESSQLNDVLSTAAAGRGRAVLLRGEAGIGKSTLLNAWTEHAQASGFAVLRGTANESERHFPLGTFLDVLERGRPYSGQLRAEYRAAVTASTRRAAAGTTDPVSATAEHLFQVVERQCATSPVLVVLDDLHWADEASTALWMRLARHAEQLPLTVAASLTPGIGEGAALAVSALQRADGLIVDLEPLASDEVEALAARQLSGPVGPSLLGALGKAGGNPLHLTELVALLRRQGRVTRGPHGFEATLDDHDLSLGAAVTDRIRRLSTELRAALRLAAVLGTEFRPADLAAVSGRPLVALVPLLEEALAASVLDPAGERLGFRHHVVWQALVESIPKAMRGALHRQAAETLDRAGAPLDQVAGHLIRATSVAADAWTRGWVARHARELVACSPAGAVEILTHAIAGDGQETDRATLHLRMVEALNALGRPDEAELIARRLLASSSCGPDVAAEASWLLGATLYARSSTDDGAREAAELVTAATTIDGISEQSRARLHAENSFYLFWSDRPDEAAEAAADAVAGGERSGETFAVAYASWMQVVMARVRDGGLDRALELSKRGLALCAGDTHPRIERLLRTQRLVITGLQDRISEAEKEIAEIRRPGECTRAYGHGAAVAIAAHRFRTGQWDEALAEIDHLGGEEFRHPDVQVHGLAALVAGLRDDTSACQARLRLLQNHPLRNPAGHGSAQWLAMARSIAAERAGRPDQALAALLPLLDQRTAIGPEDPLEWLPVVVRLALAAGDRTTAATAVALAGTGTAPAWASGTAYRKHVALHTAGLLEADPAPLLTAADYYAAASRPLQRANALEDAAELLARQGRPEDARRRLDEAATAYTGLGAAWGLRRARARLRAAGVRIGARGPRLRAATGWHSLTPTELRVAQGIAESRSNPEIAAELMISTRTVQTHVSHILAKLSFRSRVEIAAEATRQGGVRQDV